MTDRYLDAVTRGVPQNQREDVEARLRQTIDASVDARVAQGESRAGAERVVLREMGDPIRVAAERSGRSLSLIGPLYYPAYIRLLKLLLSIVVPVVAIVVGTTTALAGADLWNVLLSAVGTGFAVGVQLTFWITLVFAVIERRATDPSSVTSDWDLDDLPESFDNRIGLGDTLASITGLTLLTLLLIWQPGYQETWELGGDATPILNPELSTVWIPVLIVVLLASITLEIVTYNVGQWTIPLAVSNTVLSLAFAVSVIYIISSDQLLNPDFVAELSTGGFEAFITLVPTLIAWVVAVAAAFDITEGWWKAVRGRGGVRN